MENLIHHYTTIDVLALILKNRKLRFNRLDRIDDVREGASFGKYQFSQCLFVSCWTYDDIENIPLWNMYSKGMTGVRLSLPYDPFDYRPVKSPQTWKAREEGELLSFLPMEQLFGDGYMVNIISLFNKEKFVIQVRYVDDDELQRLREKAIKVDPSGQSKWAIEIEGPAELVGYKSTMWAFQKEIRYVLQIIPTPPMPPTGPGDPTWIQGAPGYLMRAVREGIGPNMPYIDIEIDKNALDSIKVTLAPLATESDKVIVDAQLQKYTKTGMLSESSLANLIRRRRD